MVRDFCALLEECRRKAAFSTSDLAIWFEVPRSSIFNWLHGRQPHPYRRDALDARLMALVRVLGKPKSPFPVPHFSSQYARRGYIRDVLNVVTNKKLP
jgi:hypothetical protein